MNAGCKRLSLAAALAIGGVSCSSSPSGPKAAAKITVVSGAAQADTIQAQLTAPLVVQVTGTNAAAVPSAAITFTTLGPTGSDSAAALVKAPSGGAFSTSLSGTTDANGQASAAVAFGLSAGAAHIAISVPSLNLVDTVAFTVNPGKAISTIVGPADTAIYLAGHATLHAIGVDRHGNVASTPISVTNQTGPLSLNGAPVTASAYGRGTVSFTVNSTPYLSTITVVPQARIVAGGANGLVIFNTDGSGYRTFGSANTSDPKFAASGSSLAVDQWPFVTTPLAFTADTLNGLLTSLVPTLASSTTGELFPQFSRDGQWIYFGYYDLSGKKRLWHVHPDGSGASQVPASDSAGYISINPSPSPDGTQLVYVRDQGGGNTFLRTVTIATGAVNAIDIPGHSPTWGPIGGSVAFLRPSCDCTYGPLFIMNSDGSNPHAVNGGAINYTFTIDWSTDGQWIVAAENPTGTIDIINASSGVTLPLDFTTGLRGPTWHP